MRGSTPAPTAAPTAAHTPTHTPAKSPANPATNPRPVQLPITVPRSSPSKAPLRLNSCTSIRAAWSILRLCWAGAPWSLRWAVGARLAVVVILQIVRGKATQWLSQTRRSQIDSLLAPSASSLASPLLRSFLLYGLANLGLAVQNKLYWRVRRELNLLCTERLTSQFLNRFVTAQCLSPSTYTPQGKVRGDQLDDLDDEFAGAEGQQPEHRVSEDVRTFIQLVISLSLQTLDASITLWFSIGTLRAISPFLSHCALLAAVLGTWASNRLAAPLSAMYSLERRAAGLFRYALARMRENSESIAFYRGENEELRKARQLLSERHYTEKRRLGYKDTVQLFTSMYTHLVTLVPVLALAGGLVETGTGQERVVPAHTTLSPHAGAVSRTIVGVGLVTQAREAFGEVLRSLLLIANNASDIARLRTLAIELAALRRNALASLQKTEGGICVIELPRAVAKRRGSGGMRVGDVGVVTAPWLRFEGLCVHARLSAQREQHEQLDDLHERRDEVALVNALTVIAPRSGGLLISGPSGAGKTSLLRVIAGLWKSGKGTVICAHHSEIMFLPQTTYMCLGTLRDQLLYPEVQQGSQVSDAALLKILKRVNLSRLATTASLNARRRWETELSVGEQQRVAIGRVLVHRPRFCLLDEASSANDETNEKLMYSLVRDVCVAFVSVGHRSSLEQYHAGKLTLWGAGRDGAWQLQALPLDSEGT